MSFATNKLSLIQEHFTILEIDLPAFSNGQVCSLLSGGVEGGSQFVTSDGEDFVDFNGENFIVSGGGNGIGFFTPLTCNEAWDGVTYKTYYFATANAPLNYGKPSYNNGVSDDIIIDERISRVIKSMSETVTELRPGEGLAIQGDAKITFIDFEGDPGPVQTSENGTYFGKLNARNILSGKAARVKHYAVTSNSAYVPDDALVHYYYIDSLVSNGKGVWTLNLKEELAKLDKDRTQFPIPTGGKMRLDIDDAVTAIPVDSTVDWEQIARPYTIKIGDEFMKVTAVTGNLTGAAELTVVTRGLPINYTNILSTTTASDHSSGDDVQICYTSDDQNIDDFLYELMISSGIPASVIPTAEWATEIATWHPSDKINMIWHDPTSANDVVKQVCNDFLLDIWFDPEDREIKMSAVSVWKTTGPVIREGEGITRDTFKVTPREGKRFSRAFIYYNKPDKIVNDDIENYRAVSINVNSVPEAAGLYGEPKTKEFPSSPIVGENAAALLVQRTTARFGFTPNEYSWVTEERFLNFKTGDIATIYASENQDFNGEIADVRAQITSVQPVFGLGRNYSVRALTFEPAFASGTEITISTTSNNINLHTLAGGPAEVVDLTFVISASVNSSNPETPSIRAGGFAIGSTITIILIDSAALLAAGGRGGQGGDSEIEFDGESGDYIIANSVGKNGNEGGVVYDAEGIDTDIYMGGTVSSYTSIGTIYAPGGGGGGEKGQGTIAGSVGGAGGGGGAGEAGGVGGAGGIATKLFAPGKPTTDGVPGNVGTTVGGTGGNANAGTGGNYGLPGAGGLGGALGGVAGKGIVTGGATVNIFTDGNTGRLINGNGDSVTIT